MIEIRVVKGCRLKTGVIAERSTRDVVKRDETGVGQEEEGRTMLQRQK